MKNLKIIKNLFLQPLKYSGRVELFFFYEVKEATRSDIYFHEGSLEV